MNEYFIQKSKLEVMEISASAERLNGLQYNLNNGIVTRYN